MEFHSLIVFILACLCVSISHFSSCEGSGIPSANYITWDDFRLQNNWRTLRFKNNEDGKVIVVAKDGSGDSETVQGAVDMVPKGNKERVKIFILPGIYREKVIVPQAKPFISFIGSGSSKTVISWHLKASDKDSAGQIVGTLDSSSVTIKSDYFCAYGITFQNTAPRALPGAKGMQAVALTLSGDKAMIYNCRILGSQDTLFDQTGRHYFYKCFIQGTIDFISGSATSLYKGCILNAVSESYGAIAASQRNSPFNNSGFSFVKCKITGSGMIYLGRAWGKYARVVYSHCNFDDIIIPEGWSDWGDSSRTRTVTFGEFSCTGKGAKSQNRVPWAKSLTFKEARPFLSRRFIDGKTWLKLS